MCRVVKGMRWPDASLFHSVFSSPFCSLFRIHSNYPKRLDCLTFSSIKDRARPCPPATIAVPPPSPPDGRLYQVEYAAEAIQQAGTVIGIRTKSGIVLIAEKVLQNALFDDENMQDKNVSGEKIYKLAGHIGCSVAGVTSDAYALTNHARLTAHRHYYTFQEPMAVEDLCRSICDEKQIYTQYGGVRPFGVSLLMVGWDPYYGFQLYATEPSGDYNAWAAYAIGQNDQVAQSLLKKDWRDDLTLDEAKVLGLRIISKTMDTLKLAPERLEMAVLERVAAPAEQRLLDPNAEHPKTVPSFRLLDAKELQPLIAEAEKQRRKEEEAEAEKEQRKEKLLS
ncbi:proteasome alpha 3 subunit [Strigomonas culicis]|uniref:Proteasome alpha 3 subunit n=1 Tax=Strigomonas culicis TaxID=28005 RepID=S9WDA3_9TRYP|nr:proteasome alpha 3 subunit [Strigomonas culicis]|eukprot:EPY37086.1 proteasome alpha 3 subunit [Strigomonas culicis]